MADEQGADALGPLELVRRQREQVHVERSYFDGEMGRGPDRVGVEQHAFVAAHAGRDLGDRLDRADLVVGQHDAHQDRPRSDGGFDFPGIDSPVTVDGQLDDLEAELLQVSHGVAYGVVLHGRCDDPVAARLARPGRPFDGQVVRLDATRGEDDLAWLGADRRRHALASFVKAGMGHPAKRVRRGGVAEAFRQVRQHRLERFAPQRCGGGVIEVDRHRRDCTPRPAGASPRRPFDGARPETLRPPRRSSQGLCRHPGRTAALPCRGTLWRRPRRSLTGSPAAGAGRSLARSPGLHHSLLTRR